MSGYNWEGRELTHTGNILLIKLHGDFMDIYIFIFYTCIHYAFLYTKYSKYFKKLKLFFLKSGKKGEWAEKRIHKAAETENVLIHLKEIHVFFFFKLSFPLWFLACQLTLVKAYLLKSKILDKERNMMKKLKNLNCCLEVSLCGECSI